jgi:hypothetical protein
MVTLVVAEVNRAGLDKGFIKMASFTTGALTIII